MPADLSPPSIPNHVSSLPALPVTTADPPWQTINYPTVGISTQSTSSSPAHSPFRDTPTPVNQSDGGSKGKKRSRGRYRKEDPADRYLRENMGDDNRLWTCVWVEPSHGTPDPPAAQNICGHQAPKSNARQHVKSRHLKLRYVSLLSLIPIEQPKLACRWSVLQIGHTPAPNVVEPGATKAHGTTTESANMVMYRRNQRSGLTTTLRWKAALLRITPI